MLKFCLLSELLWCTVRTRERECSWLREDEVVEKFPGQRVQEESAPIGRDRSGTSRLVLLGLESKAGMAVDSSTDDEVVLQLGDLSSGVYGCH